MSVTLETEIAKIAAVDLFKKISPARSTLACSSDARSILTTITPICSSPTPGNPRSTDQKGTRQWYRYQQKRAAVNACVAGKIEHSA
jgi:hypothetical protein